MTNKINGIDVSECCFYNNGKCDNPNGMACKCINNAVCYFKQLKLLEQENERLKEENGKLKTQYNCYACGNCKGKEDYINLEKHHKGLRKQFDKQNKKLRDIQEIVQDFCNACKEFEPEKSEDKKTCLYCNYGNILEIINNQKESEER